MRGKRSKIRHTIAAAQRRGKVLNPKQLASCEGKIRFTKERAKAKADGVDTMKYYKCQFCSHYHVGRKPWKPTKGK
jgi:hypothetical protein